MVTLALHRRDNCSVAQGHFCGSEIPAAQRQWLRATETVLRHTCPQGHQRSIEVEIGRKWTPVPRSLENHPESPMGPRGLQGPSPKEHQRTVKAKIRMTLYDRLAGDCPNPLLHQVFRRRPTKVLDRKFEAASFRQQGLAPVFISSW